MRLRSITDLYHVDQSDCFVSFGILDTLYLLLRIRVCQDLLVVLANKGKLTILLGVEEMYFLICTFVYNAQ